MEKTIRKAIAILTVATLLFALPLITAADDQGDYPEQVFEEVNVLPDEPPLLEEPVAEYLPDLPEEVLEEEVLAEEAEEVEEAGEVEPETEELSMLAAAEVVPFEVVIPVEFEEFEELLEELLELRDQLEETLEWLLDSCPAWVASLPEKQQEQLENFIDEIKFAIEVIDTWIALHEEFLLALEELDGDWEEFLALLDEVLEMTWEEIMDALEWDVAEITHVVEVIIPHNKDVMNTNWGRPEVCPCSTNGPTPGDDPAPPVEGPLEDLITAPQTGDVAPASTPLLAMMLSLFALSGGALLRRRTQ